MSKEESRPLKAGTWWWTRFKYFDLEDVAMYFNMVLFQCKIHWKHSENWNPERQEREGSRSTSRTVGVSAWEAFSQCSRSSMKPIATGNLGACCGSRHPLNRGKGSYVCIRIYNYIYIFINTMVHTSYNIYIYINVQHIMYISIYIYTTLLYYIVSYRICDVYICIHKYLYFRTYL